MLSPKISFIWFLMTVGLASVIGTMLSNLIFMVFVQATSVSKSISIEWNIWNTIVVCIAGLVAYGLNRFIRLAELVATKDSGSRKGNT